ncbi:hypothetical protein TNCV_693091 [Trichonephila clavipes]|uniref:Uncharacterized protein n=1 Tax=Trichonephila inaurata madagascariensis TaxID=2747483 RepID=A0A8X6MEX0_9ARAC|nr:hypothetical protein TNIN_499961 [Trichonephila inaurata madagascariensis]GFW00470.1 hypothetical protein TNCV_693091 [Trichonephila clavipes]
MHMRHWTALRPSSVCAARAIDEFRSSAVYSDRRNVETISVVRNFGCFVLCCWLKVVVKVHYAHRPVSDCWGALLLLSG